MTRLNKTLQSMSIEELQLVYRLGDVWEDYKYVREQVPKKYSTTWAAKYFSEILDEIERRANIGE